jgi:hypothetical protein
MHRIHRATIIFILVGMLSALQMTAIFPGARNAPVAVNDLPVIKEMPDPLVMNGGARVTTLEQWKARRREMIAILEDYEYGHMPPPPGNVKASVVTPIHRIPANARGGFGFRGFQEPASKSADGAGALQADYRKLHLTFGPGEKLGFDLGLFIPVAAASPSDASQPAKQFPILISLSFSADENGLGAASSALARGYAVATIGYNQLGADAPNYRSTAFFPAYPDYDWNDISAWAWGLSRAVDYLVTDPAIDKDKIMITGASRLGQAVLLAGALDERIALTAPVAGGMALRFSGKEMGGGLGQGIAEIVDQNTYWFGPRFAEFKGKTERLPCDQHWLLALTAPRPFIMCNSLADQYGRAYAAVQTYMGAKPVYEFLKAGSNLGLNFRPGGHGMTAEDWSALLDFADQRLLKKDIARRFDARPPADQLK